MSRHLLMTFESVVFTGVDQWGTGGDAPPLFRVGGQHRNCPPTFQFRKMAGHVA